MTSYLVLKYNNKTDTKRKYQLYPPDEISRSKTRNRRINA